MGVGSSIPRVDAADKAMGRARYTDDFAIAGLLVAKLVRSTIANGLVTAIDTTEAEKIPGVLKIITCFEVLQRPFPTAGHPWSVEPAHQDIADRLLLNRRVRLWGDEIAVVIAQDTVAADRAVRLVKVTYDEYPAITTVSQALRAEAPPVHDEYPDNILAHSRFTIGKGSFSVAAEEEGLCRLEASYHTQTVQHCHLEPPISIAYMENGRVVIVSSTQIPHIARRVVSQALGLPIGNIRVIKPTIGGGFGNKQEVLYEPLAAYLTLRMGGRPVKVELSREETFYGTRVRHAMDFTLKAAVRPDGRLVARQLLAYANQGGYASHGHAIAANAANAYRHLYQDEMVLEADAFTVYTNCSTGGAMRGYGIPQICFAMESQMDDIARALDLDPIELRLKNCMPLGYVDPGTGITCHSSGLRDCLERGRARMHWDEKRARYRCQTGSVRRGIGMAMFSYKTGVYPIALETASCRLMLNQDGSAQLQMGATEIGQGADTVFTQMAAEVIGLREQEIHIVSTQDTDVTPFDTGAYASRQTYVSGMALVQTAKLFKKKILAYASEMLGDDTKSPELRNGKIIDAATGDPLLTMEELAMEAFYSRTHSVHLTAESTVHCKDNTFSFGACFAEIEVDIPLGKIRVLELLNVHDSGRLLNPALAQAQVHGGMSMGLGYALGEQLLYDEKGRPLNGNLLDYKLPTALDTPELQVEFVETNDPSGPFGNKSLGEPPAIPVAPAIRNALLQATGVAVNTLPLCPQKLVECFTQVGLIAKEG